MPVTTVLTANGPVLVDDDGIEAWGGEVLPVETDAATSVQTETNKPADKGKRGKQTAVGAPAAAKQLDGTDKWVVVDEAGNRTDDVEYDTEEAALMAAVGG